MLTAIKENTAINNGHIELPRLDYPDGTKVEVILLVEEEIEEEMDETEYLLSTEANRERMMRVLEDSKHPESFVYIDPKDYEKGRIFP